MILRGQTTSTMTTKGLVEDTNYKLIYVNFVIYFADYDAGVFCVRQILKLYPIFLCRALVQVDIFLYISGILLLGQ
jgi:hypothetical protein